jgi:hypothetical protein
MIKLVELISYPSLDYHIRHGLSLCENVYRYSSKSFIQLFKEAREAVKTRDIQVFGLDKILLEETDLGEYGEFEGQEVPLDLPMVDEADLQEAEYKGKKVSLNKPKRGGPKKFYVYVKNPKTGKVKKVNFGAEGGGQTLSVKFREPGARASFAARHKCDQKKDKTTPGYWSCRIPRYWKSLGGNQNYAGFW